MSRFAGLLDSDQSSDADEEESNNEYIPQSKFSVLKDSSDDAETSDLTEAQAVAPIIQPPSLPSTKNKNKKKKSEKEELEDEEAFFLQLAAKNQKKAEIAQMSPSTSKSSNLLQKLQLNIAKELSERFYETSYDDSLKLPKNVSNLRFISKRKNWPSIIPSSFNFKENTASEKKGKNKRTNGPLKFLISLSDYGMQCKESFSLLQTNLNLDIMLYNLQANPFDFKLLMGIARYHLFRKEFDKATELVLRLTFIVQQTIPGKFALNSTKLIGCIDFYDVIAFIARFAFRRGCYYTSTEIWKFAISIIEDDDPDCFYLCAAVPAFYSNDLQFIDTVLFMSQNNEITFRGIPIDYIPDWTICQGLLYLTEKNDFSKLNHISQIYPDVFSAIGEDDPVEISIEKEMPEVLQKICIALKRRIKEIIMKDEVRQALLDVKTENVEEEKKRIFAKWGETQIDIDVSMIVEEDALPVNPENL